MSKRKKILIIVEKILGILAGVLISYLWTIYEYTFAVKVIDLWSIGPVKFVVVMVNIITGALLGYWIVTKVTKKILK